MTDSTPAVSEALDDCLSWAGPIKPGKQVRIIREHIADLTRQLAEAQAECRHMEFSRDAWKDRAEQASLAHLTAIHRAETAEAALADARRDAEQLRAGIEKLETLARESAAWVIAGRLKRLRESGTPAIDAAMSGGTGE